MFRSTLSNTTAVPGLMFMLARASEPRAENAHAVAMKTQKYAFEGQNAKTHLTRKHSSRMYTNRLPTVRVVVATARCQYWGYPRSNVRGYPPSPGHNPVPGHIYQPSPLDMCTPSQTYPPPDIPTPLRHTNPNPFGHTHPLGISGSRHAHPKRDLEPGMPTPHKGLL